MNGAIRKFVIPSNGTAPLDLLVRVFELTNKEILVPKNPPKTSHIVMKVVGKLSYSNIIYLVRKIRIEQL